MTAGRRPFAVLMAVLFLTFLDNTVVSVALGTVQTDLHAGVSSLQWVVDGYAAAFAGAMLAAGALADRIGRKRVLVAGLAVFTAGSVVCAVATAPSALIVGRVVMGLGAAGSEPGTLSLLGSLFPTERGRSRAVGIWVGVASLSLAAGPVVGGLLVGVGSWPAIFWFNVGMGVLLVAAAAAWLPEASDPTGRRLDLLGSLLAAGALVALVYATIDGESRGYTAARVLVLFGVGALLAAGFGVRELLSSHPVIDPAVLRLPAFSVANFVVFAVSFGTFAIFFFTALYLDEVVGYSGYEVAGIFAPMALAMVVAAVAVGRVKAAPRWPIACGTVAFAAGLVLTAAALRPQPAAWELVLSTVLAGAGIGIAAVPATASALSAAPPERAGAAASVTNTSRELGAVIGVAALGALVNSRLSSSLSSALKALGVPDAFQAVIVGALETGGVPSGGNGPTGANAAAGAGNPKLVQEVIDAAYGAFGSGLHIALVVSAVLAAAGGLAAALTLRPPKNVRRQPTNERRNSPLIPG